MDMETTQTVKDIKSKADAYTQFRDRIELGTFTASSARSLPNSGDEWNCVEVSRAPGGNLIVRSWKNRRIESDHIETVSRTHAVLDADAESALLDWLELNPRG